MSDILQSVGRWLLPVLLGLGLLSCDSFNDYPEVSLEERISDAEVRGLLSDHEEVDTYIFSFELRNSPLEDTRQYLPLLLYLQEKTGYSFEIHLTPDTDTLNSDLLHNKIDFVAMGGINYVKLAPKYKLIPLVRGLNIKGEDKYKGVIVVPFNSPIKKLSQLKGKRFAFGSPYSTQGHIIPRIMLMKAGISLDDLSMYTFTGSHLSCAEMVISGQYDACGMQDTLAQSLAEQGLLRILASSEDYPSSSIVATPKVPPQVREDVRQALLEFDPQGRDKKGLYHWNLTEMPRGFVDASVDDYRQLEKQMELLEPLPGARSSDIVPVLAP